MCADCVRVLAAYVSPKKAGGRAGALEVEGVEEPTLPLDLDLSDRVSSEAGRNTTQPTPTDKGT